jgi:transcription-repair coupling factor (superfamily II helicase)
LSDLKRALEAIERGQSFTLAATPDGFDAFVVADLTRALAIAGEKRAAVLVHVARDAQRSRAFQEALAFAAPSFDIFDFPAWDCQPYDRVSPNAATSSRRMTGLSRLARTRSSAEKPRIVCTTVDALLQRTPPRKWVATESFSAAPGNAIDMDQLARWLDVNGFARASTVRDAGEYAVRGGILDLFAPGLPMPIRLDFFGDTLESIRTFDAETQRTIGQLRALDLVPTSEAQLTTESMRRFRQGYVARFGAQTRGDALYESVSEGRRYAGMEHWLPLFYDRLDTLFDYVV